MIGYRHSTQSRQLIKMGRELYPNGKEVSHYLSPEDATTETKKLLIDSPIIYNATFSIPNFYSKSDILINIEKNIYDIVDISSNSNPKNENYTDLAFQKFVIENSGYSIRNIFVLYVNSNLIHTLPIKTELYFRSICINDKISSIFPLIKEKAKVVLSIPKSKVPPTLSENSCKSPKDCKMNFLCWNSEKEMNIFSLRENQELAKKLYNKNIYFLRDIPESEELNKNQKIQVECDKTNRVHIDLNGIEEFLKKLKYPYYYLDFEAINPVIPIYDKSRSFQHIPFLYSLQIEVESGEILNDFFIEEDEDPRLGILKKLSTLIKNDGSIICFNDTIEKKCIQESVSVYPEFSNWKDSINDNFVDLSIPFKNFSYYNPLQGGSTSLKSIITPLTGMDYKELAIQDGSLANREYLNLKLDKNLDNLKKEKLKKNLIDYCKKDTQAMITIIHTLKKILNQSM